MRILLTGGSGLMGSEFLREAPAEWDITVAVHRNPAEALTGSRQKLVPMDITNRQQVQSVLRQVQPEAVVHLGSMGSLDECEQQPERARLVNVEGPRNLLEFSEHFAEVFVFSSTIYVFDGTSPPYSEDYPTSPVNHYAQTKLEGEALVLEMSRRPVILRPMTMYGWHAPSQRRNWVTWLLDKLSKGEPVNVVDDVFNNYLLAADAAKAVRASLEKNVQGIFHVGGPETASRYDFSQKVAETFDLPTGLIERVTSDYFASLARRPGNTTCSIAKLRDVLGVEPMGVVDGLRSMKATTPPLIARSTGS